MKILISVMFLLGLVLGPGYLIYSQFMSGSSLGEFEVPSMDTELPEAHGQHGSSTSISRGGPPLILELSPDMNPISIIVSVSYPRSRLVRSRQDYVATLTKGDEKIWSEKFYMRLEPSPGGRGPEGIVKRVATFDVKEEAKYTLHLIPRGRANRPIFDSKVEVRTNVMEPIPLIFLPGLGILVVAFLTFFICLWRHLKKSGGGSHIRMGRGTTTHR
jgi:hypothetical protein